ncbi:hypothetical protein [Bdellovibrio sp. HCB274]|uniref:hypothetical protein n=1 Tax=Bdellovibrio sp. HCB274 TaxID=3394361 RepID=UPI0039B5A8C6
MFKKLVCILLSISILASCASIPTQSTYHGIVREPVKEQYDNCIVRFGKYGHRYEGGFQIADANDERITGFTQDLEKNIQFRMICRNYSIEKVQRVAFKDPITPEKLKSVIEEYEGESKVPVFSFYSRFGPHHSPYMYWFLVYIFSLGFIPLGYPEEDSFWVVKHEPGQTKSEARVVSNSRFRWLWTPFYLYPYSEKGRSVFLNDDVRTEALTKALNGY